MTLFSFWTIVFSFSLFVPKVSPAADQYSYGFQKFKPQDYLFGPNPNGNRDPFDGLRPIEANVNLAIGSDCGKINIAGSLAASFRKFFDGNYFAGLMNNAIGAAPMMTACYFSPTLCSVLKHTQLSANFLTQLRLNQCQIIDKYVDSRTEDYYRERQTCAKRAIQQNGGDMETAMDSCQNNVFQAHAGNWTGRGPQGNSDSLIADSMKWAGFEDDNGRRITELITSFVGDTVLTQGNLKVEYGPRNHAYSPRAHLSRQERELQDQFCGRLVPSVAEYFEQNRQLTDAEMENKLRELRERTTGNVRNDAEDLSVLTPTLIRNLAYLPSNRRTRICHKLAQTIAMTRFSKDMHQALDVLTAASQNPNLPPNRKQEIENKRTQLKDQIELTLKLKQEQTKPMGEVMQYIAEEGLLAQDFAVKRTLTAESGSRNKATHSQRMNDCADGIFCGIPERGR